MDALAMLIVDADCRLRLQGEGACVIGHGRRTTGRIHEAYCWTLESELDAPTYRAVEAALMSIGPMLRSDGDSTPEGTHRWDEGRGTKVWRWASTEAQVRAYEQASQSFWREAIRKLERPAPVTVEVASAWHRCVGAAVADVMCDGMPKGEGPA